MLSGPHRVLTSRIPQQNFTSCGDINLLSCCFSHLLLLNKTVVHTFFNCMFSLKYCFSACFDNMDSSIVIHVTTYMYICHDSLGDKLTVWFQLAEQRNSPTGLHLSLLILSSGGASTTKSLLGFIFWGQLYKFDDAPPKAELPPNNVMF